MCLTMARDLGNAGGRVTGSAPSRSGTGLTVGVPRERKDALVQGSACPHRLGRSEEHARLALAIVDDDDAMLDGQCLRLDAGQRSAPR